MSELKGDDWELVEGPGFNKAVDVTDRSIPEGTQSWATILQDMEMAMELNPDDIASTWSSSTDSYSSMQGNVLNSIFTTGDARHFGVITGSNHANTHINLAQLENYYDIPMENGDRTGVNVVLEPQDNTGGSTISDPVDTTPADDDNSDDDENNDDEDVSLVSD